MHLLTRVVAVGATLILAVAPVQLAGSAAASASSSYKLSYARQPHGKTFLLRWNPCRVHTYKVNLAAVPARSRKAVLAETRAAVRKLTAKTGMSFSYRGTTREVPRVGSGARQTADVVIAYTTPSKTNYPLSGSKVGYAGASLVSVWKPAGGNTHTTAILKGFVVIDTPDMRRAFRPGFGAGLSRGNLLLHELGHVVGLGDVSSSSSLMKSRLTRRTPNGYTAGDRAGLARVGRKAGCLNGF